MAAASRLVAGTTCSARPVTTESSRRNLSCPLWRRTSTEWDASRPAQQVADEYCTALRPEAGAAGGRCPAQSGELQSRRSRRQMIAPGGVRGSASPEPGAIICRRLRRLRSAPPCAGHLPPAAPASLRPALRRFSASCASHVDSQVESLAALTQELDSTRSAERVESSSVAVRPEVLETRELLEEREPHDARRPVALLADDQLRHA